MPPVFSAFTAGGASLMAEWRIIRAGIASQKHITKRQHDTESGDRRHQKI